MHPTHNLDHAFAKMPKGLPHAHRPHLAVSSCKKAAYMCLLMS